jgi:arginyl-tRNA synthetase
MQVASALCSLIKNSIFNQYGKDLDVALQPTKKEFEGTYTYVIFPLVKLLKKSPLEIGNAIGGDLLAKRDIVSGFNVVQGFINISLTDATWVSEFRENAHNYGILEPNGKKIMVEYSSPNTNKPLHLGHLRNNFLGHSVSEILKASGYEVVKTCLVNDRGIHICKSMIAYQRFGNNETPETSGLKGDHLAGKYYVAFDKAYKAEVEALKAQGLPDDEATKNAEILKSAQELLLKWEQNDPDTVALWQKMNQWVYDGFGVTYTAIGVSFDKTYYESETFLLGKDLVEDGLSRNIFFKKEDGSVWIDLTDEKLDQKLVLRKDGTSVYITQDLGTTDLKYDDFKADKSIWVVGNEQDYHFQVLFSIMKKLGRSYAEGCYHLSYGMVDLPSGKMKSREGTVVDADELVAEMINTAKERTVALGKTDGFDTNELKDLYQTLGLGALKYFLLKVDPKKKMLFNPEESIDFQGNTGPFIQYTHARICSIGRKASSLNIELSYEPTKVEPKEIEKEMIYLLSHFNDTIKTAAEVYAPSIIAQYIYDLAKTFNQFYQEVSILREEDRDLLAFRLKLTEKIGQTIKKGMHMLGISVPDRM